jgi:epoxyqueuosine reductase
VRFARVGSTPHYAAYRAFLDQGWHGEMAWMADKLPVRADPRHRSPDARTAMVLAVHHHHRRPPDPGGLTGAVARYAWGRDYHNLVGKRLKKLRRTFREQGIASWGGVDTAPILERSWASASGLGFTGKNCVSILPAKTSWMFLAVLFLDVEVAPDAPLRDHCGRCRRCLDACPTDAFAGPRKLDARRCIAYWTIEASGLAPRELRPGFGRWVFGCDVCQEVCPHNVAAADPEEDDLLPRHAWLDLPELLATDDDALMTRFLGTPIRRPKAAGLKRNALLVLGNLTGEGIVPVALDALHHDAPVVRAAAVWCLARHGHLVDADDHPLVAAEVAAAPSVQRVRQDA